MTVVINKQEKMEQYDEQKLVNYIESEIGLRDEKFTKDILSFVSNKESIHTHTIKKQVLNSALDRISEATPEWTYKASKIYAHHLYEEASINRGYDKSSKYGSFLGLINQLTDIGIYDKFIKESYSDEEIKAIGEIIVPERDELLTYPGLKSLASRYVAVGYNKEVFELPQERFAIIAMTLMKSEPKEKRLDLIKESYWAMSNLYMTVATPTLSNAGLHGQLSSCFIDTVDDSLDSIYNTNTDVATLSKFGGGIGIYMGKVRSSGSSIRGFKGASSGVIPWIKQLNNTAVSVDQLGTRQGAIAIYLDVWHKDIIPFLDLKLNNGDERKRAHDIFTGVCLPDLFMETVENRGDWYLFDPHEVRTVTGKSLEDFYDEEEGNGSFRKFYNELVNDDRISKEAIPAITIMKSVMRSQLETGTPFMFYRDTVNRLNANNHAGMIYSSNLCTEITQNMSPTQYIATELDKETGDIIVRKKSGDFVVCNLSSINLGRAVPAKVLERLIPIEVRMLDNVIEENKLPIPQTSYTNSRYRGIGLGTFGWHHLLALEGIQWDSQESVDYSDKLYDEIAYLTIKASADIAIEKGSYLLYEGSDFNNGSYFDKRGYTEDKWVALKEQVMSTGIRNGYLMAVAPNASTSVIAGSTASIDPIFKTSYQDEKKDVSYTVVAPDLNYKTYEYYAGPAYQRNQFVSIKQNSKRQRHVDQSISFNLYVPNNIKAKVLLELHVEAWKSKLKTTYYVRSTSLEVQECEWCSS